MADKSPRRVRRLLGGGVAEWGWWAAGLGMGLLIATIGAQLVQPGGTWRPIPPEAVRAALLADPQMIPDALRRLEADAIAGQIAAHRAALEAPFAGAWAGAADGDVVLVEFFDYNCPFCRQSAADVERLLAEDPKLKVVFREYPVLGEASERFARASLAAAIQGMAHHRAFYTHVFGKPGALSPERLAQSVAAAGVDAGRLSADAAGAAVEAELARNLELGRALGIGGTPSYIVGNRILPGAVGYEQMKAAIAEARGG